jgi:hypothetical protein
LGERQKEDMTVKISCSSTFGCGMPLNVKSLFYNKLSETTPLARNVKIGMGKRKRERTTNHESNVA